MISFSSTSFGPMSNHVAFGISKVPKAQRDRRQARRKATRAARKEVWQEEKAVRKNERLQRKLNGLLGPLRRLIPAAQYDNQVLSYDIKPESLREFTAQIAEVNRVYRARWELLALRMERESRDQAVRSGRKNAARREECREALRDLQRMVLRAVAQPWSDPDISKAAGVVNSMPDLSRTQRPRTPGLSQPMVLIPYFPVSGFHGLRVAYPDNAGALVQEEVKDGLRKELEQMGRHARRSHPGYSAPAEKVQGTFLMRDLVGAFWRRTMRVLANAERTGQPELLKGLYAGSGLPSPRRQ